MSGARIQLGILGDPLGHTLSPLMHRHWLAALGLPGDYTPWPTPAEDLSATLARLQADGVRGVNLTIPHKVAALALVDRLTPAAERLQAVNTLRFEPDGTRTGHNTDGAGYLDSLPAPLRETLPGRPLLLLGAGGAARAVILALLDAGVPAVTVAVRAPEKGAALAASFPSGVPVSVCPLSGPPPEALNTTRLVVNTTPVGMSPHPDPLPLPAEWLDALPLDAWVSDLIYRPRQTRLLAAAEARGLPTADGLGMLVYQGAAAFTFWSGLPVPPSAVAEVFSLLEAALADG